MIDGKVAKDEWVVVRVDAILGRDSPTIIRGGGGG